MTSRSDLTIIGSHTKISFPKLGIENVPAKVDTGADSSSIWATKVAESDGKLSFVLFAPGSPYHTGEVITTRDYRIRIVKSSFGQTEFRYKVRLKAVLEKHTVYIRFALANRSHNRFPVLIGRRTLHNRFVVDVARLSQKRASVLVIRSYNFKGTPASKNFFKDIQSNYHEITFDMVGLDDLDFMINDNGMHVTIVGSQKDIADYDFVYFRVLDDRQLAIATAVAQYLHAKDIPYADSALLQYHESVNKLDQAVTLHVHGVTIPKTYFIPHSRLSSSYDDLVKHLGCPFLLKDIIGLRGRNLFLIKNLRGFEEACLRAELNQITLIAQEFIPHDCHYRVLIMGSRIYLIIKLVHRLSEPRRQQKSVHFFPTLIAENKLPKEVKTTCISVSDILGIDIAGVDMLKDKRTDVWYCLEVNENPQLVTGAFVNEKEEAFAKYLSNKVRRLP
jgi:glutathione synthase/RimK-type ligase-like ATP-grasp enzyme